MNLAVSYLHFARTGVIVRTSVVTGVNFLNNTVRVDGVWKPKDEVIYL